MNGSTARSTAACLTAAGRGAVAVIRVTHSPLETSAMLESLFQPANGKRWHAQPVQRLIYGAWGTEAREDVVLCRVTDTNFEIQCHGGDAAVNRILQDLARHGIATVSAVEQTAVLQDQLDAELQSSLTQALTVRTADWLHEQSCGLLRAAFERLPQVTATAESRQQALRQIDDLLVWSRFGRHLTQPWQVVLTGRPNVGKSSLINALLGFQRAIVSEIPGTTRDVVSSITAFDGWPVELSDTAGMRTTDDLLENAGINRARDRLLTADLRIVVIDLSQPPTAEDHDLTASWPDALVVAHKCDLPDGWGDEAGRFLRVSSRTGEGLGTLQAAIVAKLVPQVPEAGTPVPMTERQCAYLERLKTLLLENRMEEYCQELPDIQR